MLLALPACSDGRGDDPAPAGEAFLSARDSAGVVLVEHHQISPGISLRIADTPTLTIGAHSPGEVASPGRYEFGSSITSAARMNDGGVIVASWGDTSLHVFDPAGRFVRSIGRKGPGPGEFLRMVGFCRGAADTLVALDANGSVIRFDHEGNHVATSVLPLVIATTQPGCLFDGTVVQRAPLSPDQWRGQLPPEGQAYRKLVHIRLTPTPKVLHELVRLGSDDPRLRIQGSKTFMAPPFARRTEIVADSDRIHVADGSTYEVRSYTPEWRLVRILRGPDVAPLVSPSMRARYREDYLGRLGPALRAAAGQVLANDSVFPERLPPHGRVVVDRVRRLWVESYPIPGDSVRRWIVFDPDGAVVGQALTPKSLIVLEIGADYFLGWRSTIESGVAVRQVQLYPIIPR